MPKKKSQGLKRGDFVEVAGIWYHVNMSWEGFPGQPNNVLATPVTSPHLPERQSLGLPRIIHVPDGAKVVQQGGPSSLDTEADPFKGSGRK